MTQPQSHTLHISFSNSALSNNKVKLLFRSLKRGIHISTIALAFERA